MLLWVHKKLPSEVRAMRQLFLQREKFACPYCANERKASMGEYLEWSEFMSAEEFLLEYDERSQANTYPDLHWEVKAVEKYMANKPYKYCLRKRIGELSIKISAKMTKLAIKICPKVDRRLRRGSLRGFQRLRAEVAHALTIAARPFQTLYLRLSFID
jgi:hypothetical protein